MDSSLVRTQFVAEEEATGAPEHVRRLLADTFTQDDSLFSNPEIEALAARLYET